jgi:biotin carboxylase
MSHILLIELPGGDDTDIVDAALSLGHELTFLTGDLQHYQNKTDVMTKISMACDIVEVRPFDYSAVEQKVLEIHSAKPIDALLCLVDIRMIEASRLAARLALRFLNPDSAALLRDKFSVRNRLRAHGIRQPRYDLATSNADLRSAVAAIGLPAVIKPSDGYGSQNIVVLRDENDLHPLLTPLDDFLPQRLDYGLGVQANDRLLVEHFIEGTIVGCDTITIGGRHHLLGINEKEFFPPPSFAIRGSCFPSGQFDKDPIRDYVFEVLNAVGFDWGMAHVELILTRDGPMLVEVNPRLVGAKIPRLLNLVFDRSIHADLIALHLGNMQAADFTPAHFAVSRWFVASQCGVLKKMTLPTSHDSRIRHIEIIKKEGEHIRPPFHNGDRIGYVMVTADDRASAESIAEAFIRDVAMEVATG